MILSEETAIVTGVSSGLGRALSIALVNQGAKVYGVARSIDKLQSLQHELGDMFIPVALDVTQASSVSEWVQNTFSDVNSPAILINNAGVGYLQKLGELSAQQWEAMINTNLNGMYYITAAVLPFMKQNAAHCHILNIGSILGKTTNALSAGYSATKFGVQGFSQALFKELRGFGIKVTCVNPGSIETSFFQASGIESHAAMLQPQEVAQLLVYLLQTPDNLLVDEITLRPLNPSP